MSYEPTVWKAGDTVTSVKLNKIEQGIASAGGANILVAHLINSTITDSQGGEVLRPTISGTLDVTLEEIENADFTIIKLTTDDGVGNTYIQGIYYYENYNFYVLETPFSLPGGSDPLVFFATNGDDYPTTSAPEENEQ